MVDKHHGKNILLADLRSAVNMRFPLAVAGVVLCFCLDNWETLKVIPYSRSGSLCVFYFFFNSYSFGGIFMSYFSCLLAALPFSARYSQEHQGGMNVYALFRCGKRNYAISKILVAGLSGGAVLFLGALIFILTLTNYLPIVTPSKLIDYQGLPYYNALASGEGWRYFFITLYLAFLSGTLYGCAGMAVSAFFPIPCVSICAPMVLNFIIVEFGRLARLPSGLRLDLLLKARGKISSDRLTLVLVTTAVFIICWAFYKFFLTRVCQRLEEAERC